MKDVLAVLLLLVILVSIIMYLIRTKKRGETCIGCPYARQCGGKCNGGCGAEAKDNMENICN